MYQLLVQMTRIIELFLVTIITFSFSQYSEDTCNWILWDSAEDVDGIRTIHPSCSEGNVQWKQPYGAARVSFNPNVANFELCFIAKTVKSTIKISREESDGLRHLSLLADNGDINSENHKPLEIYSKEICLQSNDQNAIVIYIETVLDSSSHVGQFVLNYDIRKHPSSSDENVIGMQECRPCNDEEIIRAACYSDFIVKGKIEHVFHASKIGESEIFVTLDKIYRQVHHVFKEHSVQVISNDILQSDTRKPSNTKHSSSKRLSYKGQVIVPHKCRTSKGDGTFIFMGKIRLKRAHLHCAPRLEDFERIWKDAIRLGAAQCVLG